MACAELGVILTEACKCAADDPITQMCYKNYVCFKVDKMQFKYICARNHINGHAWVGLADLNKYCKSTEYYYNSVSLITGKGKCDYDGKFYPLCTKFNVPLAEGEECACNTRDNCKATSMCYFNGMIYEHYSYNFGGISYYYYFALIGENNEPAIIPFGYYYDPVGKVLIKTCESQFTPTSQTCLCNPADPNSEHYKCKEKYYCDFPSCQNIAEMYRPCAYYETCGERSCSQNDYCVNTDFNKTALDSGSFCVSEITDGYVTGNERYGSAFCTAKGVGQICFGKDTLCTADHGCKCAVKGEGITSYGPCYGDETHYCELGQEWNGLECLDPSYPAPEYMICNFIHYYGNYKCGDKAAIVVKDIIDCIEEYVMPRCKSYYIATERCTCNKSCPYLYACCRRIISKGAICTIWDILCSPGYEYTDERHIDCKRSSSAGGPEIPMPCRENQSNCFQILPGICKADSIGCICNNETIAFKYCYVSYSGETVLESCMAKGGLSDDFVVLKPCICGTVWPKLVVPGEICRWGESLKYCSYENGNMEADNKVIEKCYCKSCLVVAEPNQYCIDGNIHMNCERNAIGYASKNYFKNWCFCDSDIVEYGGYCYTVDFEANRRRISVCTDSSVVLEEGECVCTHTGLVARTGEQCIGTPISPSAVILDPCPPGAAGEAKLNASYTTCGCGSDEVRKNEYCYSEAADVNLRKMMLCTGEPGAITPVSDSCVCTESPVAVALPGRFCRIGTAVLARCLEDTAACTTVNASARLCRYVAPCVCAGSELLPAAYYCHGLGASAATDCEAIAAIGVLPAAGHAVANEAERNVVCGPAVVAPGAYCYATKDGTAYREIPDCATTAGSSLPHPAPIECVCGGAVCEIGSICSDNQCLGECAGVKHCQYCDDQQACRICAPQYQLSYRGSCDLKASSIGMIAGIAAGIIALVVICAVTAALLVRKRQRTHAKLQKADYQVLLLPVDLVLSTQYEAGRTEKMTPVGQVRHIAAKLPPIAAQSKNSRQGKHFYVLRDL